jgi:hypothetical protein
MRKLDTGRKKFKKEVNEWDERKEEAFCIISFTVSDSPQAPTRYGKTSKGA